MEPLALRPKCPSWREDLAPPSNTFPPKPNRKLNFDSQVTVIEIESRFDYLEYMSDLHETSDDNNYEIEIVEDDGDADFYLEIVDGEVYYVFETEDDISIEEEEDDDDDDDDIEEESYIEEEEEESDTDASEPASPAQLPIENMQSLLMAPNLCGDSESGSLSSKQRLSTIASANNSIRSGRSSNNSVRSTNNSVRSTSNSVRSTSNSVRSSLNNANNINSNGSTSSIISNKFILPQAFNKNDEDEGSDEEMMDLISGGGTGSSIASSAATEEEAVQMFLNQSSSSLHNDMAFDLENMSNSSINNNNNNNNSSINNNSSSSMNNNSSSNLSKKNSVSSLARNKNNASNSSLNNNNSVKLGNSSALLPEISDSMEDDASFDLLSPAAIEKPEEPEKPRENMVIQTTIKTKTINSNASASSIPEFNKSISSIKSSGNDNENDTPPTSPTQRQTTTISAKVMPHPISPSGRKADKSTDSPKSNIVNTPTASPVTPTGKASVKSILKSCPTSPVAPKSPKNPRKSKDKKANKKEKTYTKTYVPADYFDGEHHVYSWEKPQWTKTKLKSTGKGDAVRKGGNLANPITFPVKKPANDGIDEDDDNHSKAGNDMETVNKDELLRRISAAPSVLGTATLPRYRKHQSKLKFSIHGAKIRDGGDIVKPITKATVIRKPENINHLANPKILKTTSQGEQARSGQKLEAPVTKPLIKFDDTNHLANKNVLKNRGIAPVEKKKYDWSKPSWATEAKLKSTGKGNIIKQGGNVARPITNINEESVVTPDGEEKRAFEWEKPEWAKGSFLQSRSGRRMPRRGMLGRQESDSNMSVMSVQSMPVQRNHVERTRSYQWDRPIWAASKREEILESTDKGSQLKQGENLANPITFPVGKSDGTNKQVQPDLILKHSEKGQDVRRGENLARPITDLPAIARNRRQRARSMDEELNGEPVNPIYTIPALENENGKRRGGRRPSRVKTNECDSDDGSSLSSKSFRSPSRTSSASSLSSNSSRSSHGPQ